MVESGGGLYWTVGGILGAIKGAVANPGVCWWRSSASGAKGTQ